MSKGHVLITGGAGYIGSVMTGLLLERDYEVTVLDRFFFGDTLARYSDNPDLHQVKADVRSFDPKVFDGVDAVFDLAALSNDPAGELVPGKTLDINHQGRARCARLAKEAGVGRYVLASSCSLYGFQDDIVDETSPVNPLTTYAKANGLAEESNLPLADDDFTATALRQATVFGLSPRMRFDLAINGMTLALHKWGNVKVMRPGTQWRPMVHVRDTSRAFIAVMEADPAKVNGEVFNVGDETLNLQIGPLAKRVSEAVGIEFVEDWYGDPDHRSYQVGFEKIKKTLPWKAEVTPEMGAKEIFDALAAGETTDSPETKTVQWYEALEEWNQRIKAVAMDGGIL
ncbi:MAG: NAD-dependent epimerase/dehydratase family protein [Thermoplasmatota archaeon]